METPTWVNPLGAKGIGESGTIGSTPAVQNAVCDALGPPRRAPRRHALHAGAGVAGHRAPTGAWRTWAVALDRRADARVAAQRRGSSSGVRHTARRGRAGATQGGALVEITLSVNGEERSSDVEPRRLLVHHLRDDLGLTGTNVGCDTSSCGACTVLLDGESVKSCTVLAVQADGHEITTIEGLAATAGDGDGELHPMQRAFHEQHGLQCGFCTPGMVMAAVSLLEENPHPTEHEVRDGPRGQPVPLHRLPQHRAGGAGRRRRRGAGMTATDHRGHAGAAGETGAALRAAAAAQGGRPPAHRRGPLRRRPADPRRAVAGHGAQPVRPRPHRQHRRHRRRWPCPGVRHVLTGDDLAGDVGRRPCRAPGPSPTDMKSPDHWPVARGKACYVGDIVAVVVADTRYQAADAVDAVVVDYDPLARRGRPRGRRQPTGRHPRRTSAPTAATRGRCRPTPTPSTRPSPTPPTR